MLKKVFLLPAMMLCFACNAMPSSGLEVTAASSQDLWNKPIQKPIFIRGFEFSTNDSHTLAQICVHVNEFEIWEPGDYSDDVYVGIQRTTQVLVDGVLVPRDRLQFSSLAILLAERDQYGNVIGSHGGGTAICFDVLDLTTGLHVSYLRFESTSGSLYEYTWAFEVVRENGIMTINFPDVLRS